MTLNHVNTYSGATTVSAGTLQVGNGAVGNLTGNTAVTVSGTAGLVLDQPTGSAMNATIALNGTGSGPYRNLQVVVTTTGAIRMCDPAVPNTGTDPRRCLQ